MEALIITGLIAIIAIVIVLSGFCIVQQSETRVVERLGKYSRTLESGINILIPIIDKPRTMYVRSVFEAYIAFLPILVDLLPVTYPFLVQSQPLD